MAEVDASQRSRHGDVRFVDILESTMIMRPRWIVLRCVDAIERTSTPDPAQLVAGASETRRSAHACVRTAMAGRSRS
jgi:hypothetical protein